MSWSCQGPTQIHMTQNILDLNVCNPTLWQFHGIAVQFFCFHGWIRPPREWHPEKGTGVAVGLDCGTQRSQPRNIQDSSFYLRLTPCTQKSVTYKFLIEKNWLKFDSLTLSCYSSFMFCYSITRSGATSRAVLGFVISVLCNSVRFNAPE